MRYLDELTRDFVHIGLTEGQETSLCEMAQKISAEVSAIMDEGSQTSNQLREAVVGAPALARGWPMRLSSRGL